MTKVSSSDVSSIKVNNKKPSYAPIVLSFLCGVLLGVNNATDLFSVLVQSVSHGPKCAYDLKQLEAKYATVREQISKTSTDVNEVSRINSTVLESSCKEIFMKSFWQVNTETNESQFVLENVFLDEVAKEKLREYFMKSCPALKVNNETQSEMTDGKTIELNTINEGSVALPSETSDDILKESSDGLSLDISSSLPLEGVQDEETTLDIPTSIEKQIGRQVNDNDASVNEIKSKQINSDETESNTKNDGLDGKADTIAAVEKQNMNISLPSENDDKAKESNLASFQLKNEGSKLEEPEDKVSGPSQPVATIANEEEQALDGDHDSIYELEPSSLTLSNESSFSDIEAEVKKEEGMSELFTYPPVSPSSDVKKSRSYMKMGKAYQQQGKLELAIKEFKKAIKKAPDLYESYKSLAEVLELQASEGRQESMQELTQVLREASDNHLVSLLLNHSSATYHVNRILYIASTYLLHQTDGNGMNLGRQIVSGLLHNFEELVLKNVSSSVFSSKMTKMHEVGEEAEGEKSTTNLASLSSKDDSQLEVNKTIEDGTVGAENENKISELLTSHENSQLKLLKETVRILNRIQLSFASLIKEDALKHQSKHDAEMNNYESYERYVKKLVENNMSEADSKKDVLDQNAEEVMGDLDQSKLKEAENIENNERQDLEQLQQYQNMAQISFSNAQTALELRNKDYEKAIFHMDRCLNSTLSVQVSNSLNHTNNVSDIFFSTELGRVLNKQGGGDDDNDVSKMDCLDMKAAIMFSKGDVRSALSIWNLLSDPNNYINFDSNNQKHGKLGDKVGKIITYANKYGEALHQLGEFENASNAFSKAIAWHEKELSIGSFSSHESKKGTSEEKDYSDHIPVLYFNLGVAQRSLGNSTGALECFEFAQSLGLSHVQLKALINEAKSNITKLDTLMNDTTENKKVVVEENNNNIEVSTVKKADIADLDVFSMNQKEIQEDMHLDTKESMETNQLSKDKESPSFSSLRDSKEPLEEEESEFVKSEATNKDQVIGDVSRSSGLPQAHRMKYPHLYESQTASTNTYSGGRSRSGDDTLAAQDLLDRTNKAKKVSLHNSGVSGIMDASSNQVHTSSSAFSSGENAIQKMGSRVKTMLINLRHKIMRRDKMLKNGNEVTIFGSDVDASGNDKEKRKWTDIFSLFKRKDKQQQQQQSLLDSDDDKQGQGTVLMSEHELKQLASERARAAMAQENNQRRKAQLDMFVKQQQTRSFSTSADTSSKASRDDHIKPRDQKQDLFEGMDSFKSESGSEDSMFGLYDGEDEQESEYGSLDEESVALLKRMLAKEEKSKGFKGSSGGDGGGFGGGSIHDMLSGDADVDDAHSFQRPGVKSSARDRAFGM